MQVPDKAKLAVKEMKSFLVSHNMHLTEEQVFAKLIECNMFDVFGNPTQYAIDNEYVETV
ncbi:hypothetical protein ABE042_04985 [Viridibacillus arvi]|uniref:hypothetical protein n=1 Tax=Viridibacillus arvi TaxID=263475 RepID=UPI003D2DA787